jgi:hypothetical protein
MQIINTAKFYIINMACELKLKIRNNEKIWVIDKFNVYSICT